MISTIYDKESQYEQNFYMNNLILMIITFPQNLFIIPYFINNYNIENDDEIEEALDEKTWRKKTTYLFRNFNHSINLLMGSFGLGFYLFFVVFSDVAMERLGITYEFIGWNKLSYLVLSTVSGI